MYTYHLALDAQRFFTYTSDVYPGGRCSFGSWADFAFKTYVDSENTDVLVISGDGTVGVGTAVASEKLTVAGRVAAEGFIGDGSGLTNIPSSSFSLSGRSVTELDDVSDAGSQQIITAAERAKLIGVEEGAEVTDAAHVSAAGAAMDSDFGAEGLMRRGAAPGSYSIIGDNSADWNAAYGWGDHAGFGYATGSPVYIETDPIWTNARAVGFTMGADLDMGGHAITNVAVYGDGAGLTNLPAMPPVAVLCASPAHPLMAGAQSESVTYSLAHSYDPQGQSLAYAIDLGATRSAPPAPHDYRSNATLSVNYPGPGRYAAAGWVKNDADLYARSFTVVSVVSLSNTTVTSDSDVGSHCSLAVIAGHPAIAYYDATGQDLMYVRASNALGTAWSSPVQVDTNGNAGTHASLTEVAGRPAIAYYRATAASNYLVYARAADAGGSSWDTPVTIAETNTSCWFGYASLQVVDGRPAAAYYNSNPSSLRYARANDADGSSWGAPVTADSVNNPGRYASLRVVDGRPAVAYWRADNDDLYYVRASNASGSSWATPVPVVTSGSSGQYPSLAVVGGRPAIAYYFNGSKDSMYVRSDDATGSSWGSPVALESADEAGAHACLAVVGGRPTVIGFNDTGDTLRFLRSSDATGSSWPSPTTLDTVGSWATGKRNASLAEVHGRPGVAYYDKDTGDLKYVYAVEP